MRATVISIALLLTAVPAAGVLATPAAIAAPGELDRARALVKEAQPHVELAMNPDNASGVRKKGRKAAYKLLKQARGLFDAYLDANPGKTDALDREYCSLSSNIYWIKKFATLNEFRGGDADRPVELPGAKKADDGGGGGIGGTSSRNDPPKEDPPPRGDPPPQPPPPKPPAEGDPPTDEEGPKVVEPPALDPAALRAQEARDILAAIEAEEAKRPGDVAHAHALYEKYLFEFDDPTLPEYQKAALKLGALTDRMKIVLKEESGVDPDDFDVADSAEVTRVVKTLSKMLKKGSDEERRKAAELLGKLGTGAAGFPLVNVLRDKDPEVARLAGDGLVAIGGRRVAVNLTKTYRGKKPEAEMAALDVLRRICAKGDVDARSVSEQLGRFMLSNTSKVAEDALDALIGLGSAGGPGLMEALETRNVIKRVAIIDALGRIKYYKSATSLTRFLLRGDAQKTVMQRNATLAALKVMGKPAVPFLIPGLKDKRTRGWTAVALRDVSGVTLSSRPRDWQKWWEENGGGSD